MSACAERLQGTATVSAMRLPARSSELSTARRYAEEAAAAFGLGSRGCYEFAVAVNEAVTNALRHGAPDGHGHIHLSVIEGSDSLTFVVCDYGTYTPPVAAPSPTSERGRGFTLMSTLMDDVRVYDAPGETAVHLTKLRA